MLEKKSFYIIISKIIGKLLEQNKNKETIVEIKDIGKSMKTGGRYHQTKEGGSYHTDGSHIFQNPPDYVGLFCINPAKTGGVSKFMSAYTIHNKLLKNNFSNPIKIEKQKVGTLHLLHLHVFAFTERTRLNLNRQNILLFLPYFKSSNQTATILFFKLGFKYICWILFSGKQ